MIELPLSRAREAGIPLSREQVEKFEVYHRIVDGGECAVQFDPGDDVPAWKPWLERERKGDCR